ncbi:ATP-dependent DNA helicase RecG [Patescibacteria group bacterium]|nr:ATP-dependent DNA helicase RecG [Patescibacteria group bacterium]
MLDTLLTDLRKIDKRHRDALKRLGLFTVRDFIFYFPVDYEDFSTIIPINMVKPGEVNTVQGIISEIYNEQTQRQRMMLTKATLEDKTGSLESVWFRQPYLEKFLKTGSYVTLSGKVEYNRGRDLQMTSPVYEKYRPEALHTGRIAPVYSLTAGITSKWLRFVLKPYLKHVTELEEFLPQACLKRHRLLARNEALKQIHFPDSQQSLAQAKYRLGFEEMFLLQAMKLQKRSVFKQARSYSLKFDKKLAQKFVKKLPFTLTDDQKKASWQVFQNLEQNKPMNRLLEGDVGSGKTVVTALILNQVLKQGYQGVFLAPTEILATQHYQSFLKFFADNNFNIALFTRTQRFVDKKEISTNKLLKKIKDGEIDLIIGTHTLLSEKVKTKKLALAIIDEQHRFGVKQRATLKTINTGNKIPHFLSMTATPIPRTLALSIFGDLDLSVIKEMPKNRKPIKTSLVAPFDREETYDFIRQRINKGDQVFVVCPLIEESDTLGVKSVKEEYKKLNQQVFPEIKIGLLHGKLKKEQKEKAMQNFLAKKTKILVSTSVIEVGVDIPNATIMMIEGSERFGLSQLHQFRGRVGRGQKQSYCYLFTDSLGEKSYNRLKTMENCLDGFQLAQHDLEIRGPGEVYGIRQSGLPDLKMASLTDAELVAVAREEALELVTKDPDFREHPQLKNELLRFEKTVHFE